MGKRRARSTLACPLGNPIARELKPDRPELLRPGYCQACGEGPLHAAAAACPCSFLRERRRFCRECAIAFDYVTLGHTRIKSGPFTPEEWRGFIDIHARGIRAVLRRRD